MPGSCLISPHTFMIPALPPTLPPTCPPTLIHPHSPMPGHSASGRLAKNPTRKVESREAAAVAVTRLSRSSSCRSVGGRVRVGAGSVWIYRAGLGWAGLGWAGLGWAGLGWAGLSWSGQLSGYGLWQAMCESTGLGWRGRVLLSGECPPHGSGPVPNKCAAPAKTCASVTSSMACTAASPCTCWRSDLSHHQGRPDQAARRFLAAHRGGRRWQRGKWQDPWAGGTNAQACSAGRLPCAQPTHTHACTHKHTNTCARQTTPLASQSLMGLQVPPVVARMLGLTCKAWAGRCVSDGELGLNVWKGTLTNSPRAWCTVLRPSAHQA
jgi:hypothetical protein